MWLNAQNVLNPVLLIAGDHDGFPAYEIYVDLQTIFQHDPRDHGQGLGSLFPPTDFIVPLRAEDVE